MMGCMASQGPAAGSAGTPSPGSTRPLPEYLLAMVRRTPPEGVPTVAGSTPVVAFGNPMIAEVATLGINPSKVEFVGAAGPLTDGKRRLATLGSLVAHDLSMLTDTQVRQVLADCAAYFAVNPYRRWFDPLDKLMSDAVGASYYDGTACHLDLVQWATDPVWGQLHDKTLRNTLLDDGVPHLRAQLRHENIRLVLLNGRTVLNQVEGLGLATLTAAGKLPIAATTCTLYSGEAEGVQFLGWSTNLQSSHGVTKAFKTELADWLATQATGLETTGPGTDSTANLPPAPASRAHLDGHGYLASGTTVIGKPQLADLLTTWLNSSNTPTIGDIGGFGGSAWIRIQLGDHTAVLNRDTKRHAITEYLQDTLRRGVAAPWRIITNRKGVLNKVVFREDGEQTPGWYCYLTKPLTAPTEL